MPWDMSYDDYPDTGNRPGQSTDDLYDYRGMSLYSTIHPQSQEWRESLRNPEWHTTPSGDDCLWCAGSAAEPADNAETLLCRGHLAEYLGESLDSLDRAEADARADMSNLGYFD